MQAQILIASMLLSMAIAAILAFYTSKIIAHPINAVTNIAQRVTQEANFDLQAPVTTEDVGALTSSLNQLIQQVKHLLEEQQAEARPPQVSLCRFLTLELVAFEILFVHYDLGCSNLLVDLRKSADTKHFKSVLANFLRTKGKTNLWDFSIKFLVPSLIPINRAA